MNLTNTSNRLINEKSPYLLQHAHNPVDWYPWSDEAFKKAKENDVPIFLSIGYSCCHWCHVMEKESFENEEVAKILNNNFVSIKVDREERPDIDSIYMRVCQVLTGSGGWPLTIIMTPDQKPFFAGTYFPRNDKNGMTGLVSILKYVEEHWKNDKTKLLEAGNHMLNIINESNTSSKNDVFQDIPQKAFLRFRQNFDSSYGGFGTQPKFPSPHNLMFLISYWYKTGDQLSLKMVNKTLDCMEMGGIYDHIGYGFSRYSVDRKWLVPHFEKMLYDNALLAITYLMASKASGNKKYSTTAKNILTYILRDMTSKEGGFYSAEDADSEGEEGKFYTWSADEIVSVLGKDYGNKFCSYFNITPQGNFDGKNIPNLIGTSTENMEDIEFIKICREKLFNYRENRVHPLKDDKILTSWNGLMITAMSMAGRFLNDNKYIAAAENAVDFIYKKLIREDGRLLSRYRDGESSFPGYADDYAFLILGLIELYETTYNPNYLKMAVDLNKDLLKFFWDEKDGGFFIYGSDSEQLIMRPKEIYDGAIPSANSVSALNFLKLYHLTGNYKFQEMAEQIFKCFASEINNSPMSYSFSLFAFQFFQSQTRQIIVVSDSTAEETKKVMDIINERSNPFTISLLYFNSNKILESVCPSIKDYKTIDGKITVYICENFVCKKPITDINLLSKIL